MAEPLLNVADDVLGFPQRSPTESQVTPTRFGGRDIEKPEARFDTGFHQFKQDMAGDGSLVRLRYMTTLPPLRAQE